MTSSVVILAAALCCLSAFSNGADLNNYKHTFSLMNALDMSIGNDSVAGTLPRKINVTADQITNCRSTPDNGFTFYGIRGHTVDGSNNNYLYSLYDVNGVISGVQVATPKEQVNTVGFNYSAVPSFNEETRDGVVYKVITVYFVPDPRVICAGGRTDFETAGTASAVNLQNGPTPSDLRNAPFNRSVALASGNYSDDNCFIGMGRHTFSAAQTWQANNCTRIIPIFLLQNEAGDLVGFGLAWTGASKSNSSLFEKPDDKAINLIVKNPPQCLVNLSSKNLITTVHIYFTQKPYNCEEEMRQKVKEAYDSLAAGVTRGLNAVAGAFSSLWG
jgi:hypothetical protein